MPSEQYHQFVQLLSAARVTPELEVEAVRAGYDSNGSMAPVPPDTDTAFVELGEVPAEDIRVGDVSDRAALVWFHGGGYVIGSLESHRPLAAHLSAACGLPVLLVDYRRAPEDPYPAAFDDGSAALAAAHGRHPAGVAVGGDSAGGGLALSVVAARIRDGDPAPKAVAVVSPWTDVAVTGESVRTNTGTDPVLSRELLEHWGSLYCGDTDASHPQVSPLHADLSGFPPLLIHASGSELLADDARRLASRARAAGVDVTIDMADDLVHHWHVWAGLLPEADESVEQLGAWVRRQLLEAAANQE